jgi:hypothetical protein
MTHCFKHGLASLIIDKLIALIHLQGATKHQHFDREKSSRSILKFLLLFERLVFFVNETWMWKVFECVRRFFFSFYSERFV